MVRENRSNPEEEDVEDELRDTLDVWSLEQTNAGWDPKPTLTRYFGS